MCTCLFIYIACKNGHLNCVSWLLTSDATKDSIDINHEIEYKLIAPKKATSKKAGPLKNSNTSNGNANDTKTVTTEKQNEKKESEVKTEEKEENNQKSKDINPYCSKTPLMVAIENSTQTCVKELCKRHDLKILESKNEEDKNGIDLAVQSGNVAIFSILIITLLDRYNIDTIEGLLKNSTFFNEKLILSWLDICQTVNNAGLFAFLTSMYENPIKEKNFGLLRSSLETSIEDNNSALTSVLNQNRKDLQVSNYLFKHCKIETLNDLSKVITNGLSKQECGFNDSLLFLAKMVNNELFNQTLDNVTKDCLTASRKTIEKYTFFKNNLLNSNIWAINVNEDEDKGKNKNKNENQNEKKNGSVTSDEKTATEAEADIGDGLLFNKVELSSIENELMNQKQFIKDEIIKLEKEHLKDWQEVKYSIKVWNVGLYRQISQTKIVNKYTSKMEDLMSEFGIQSDYKLNELPFDNVNGFNGSQECDHRAYLTKLLLASHQVNPLFQKQCQEVFESFNKIDGISCKYASAPVKTRERSQMKGDLDYIDKIWPHTSNILG